ncbi:N-acetyl-alpha-D-glucosaminyl L-malate synthase BshA [Alicyclobacillus sp.]|uniref:N-acetyl-alpha-D-glucosaminyl L-malate synthase BshA n=1 Tax=Alicyclobacillus sp. TaxID=61169 RepID=UPI0025BB6FEB|nr:N-acetyl-alpha-D-glucosaminyl L-malate synthase BshA [Alicyclobacillus sp.]MCL6515529.1 N-acetyl-alpha-D-glucosaminyl L-malate synthase BshA [Alicyclobacillus sp.]
MRIGISCHPALGGSGALAAELGKGLARRGHEVHFIVTDIPFRLGAFHPRIQVHEVDTMPYPVWRTPPLDLALAAWMARVADQHALDVLHVHYALPFAVCAWLARAMAGRRVPVVTTLHGTDVTVLAEDHTWHELIRFGLVHSDAVTAVSRDLAMRTKERFHLEGPIHCIHNFIDPRVFHPAEVAPLRDELAPGGERILLHVSNFRPVKRVADVLHVFAKVRRGMPARLVMVGEGPDEWEARRLAHALGVAEDVVFLGKQEDVVPLYQVADLFLLPSRQESFGLVALEAMACGVPVIASDAGGLPEVVVHGQTGYLRPVGDVEGMAADALGLLQNDRAHRRMREQAADWARTAFSIEEKLDEYERLYESVLKEAPA